MDIISFTKFVYQYAERYKKFLIMFAIGVLIQVLILIFLPMALRYIFDHVIPEKEIDKLIVLSVLLLISLIFKALTELMTEYYIASLTANIIVDIRKKLLNRVYCLRIDYLKNTDQGDIIAHFTNDLSAIENIIISELSFLAKYICLSVVSIVVLFYFDALLTIFSIVSFLIPLVVCHIITNKALLLNKDKKQIEGKMFSLFYQLVSAQMPIRAYNLQSFWTEKSMILFDKWKKVGISAQFFNSFTSRGLTLITHSFEVIIILIAALFVIYGRFTIGTVFGYLFFYQYVTVAFEGISEIFPSFFSGMAAANRINNFLNRDVIEVNKHEEQIIKSLQKEITFNNVSFSYQEQNCTLKNINMNIKKNQFIALVGESGAGKSTILSLLLKFHSPSSGNILFDNIDLEHISSSSLRDIIRVVFQENTVFDLSIYDNILVGNLNASKEQVINAAKYAELHDYITTLPQGYKTIVGPSRGVLSGGQRQRLALARALVANPDILLLDEITSALDLVTEDEINKTISHIMRNNTIIMITHRLRTVVSADYIYVFNNGNIVEMGKHEDLLAINGYYNDLWKKQL